MRLACCADDQGALHAHVGILPGLYASREASEVVMRVHRSIVRQFVLLLFVSASFPLCLTLRR
jgi:hypothetical protein